MAMEIKTRQLPENMTLLERQQWVLHILSELANDGLITEELAVRLNATAIRIQKQRWGKE